ncbi:MAG: hypothetical protein ABW056_13085 [Thermoanaerobaculia bacterium]
MDRSAETLPARARRAYERARWSRALLVAVLIPPAASLAFLRCAQPLESVICSVALAALVAALLYRGQDWGRGARAGLVAGMAPFLFPILIETFGSPELCEQLPWFCGAGGVAAGLFLGARGRTRMVHPKAYWAAACAVALMAGAVGCWLAGAAGLAGLALGFAAGAVPTLALRPA